MFNLFCIILTKCNIAVHGVYIDEIIQYEAAENPNRLLIEDFFKIIFIIIFSITSSFFLGRFLHSKIIAKRLDLKWDFLRFKNKWFYILNGRDYLVTDVFPDGFYSEVFLLCEIGNSIILYKGSLESYKLKDESLEYICLQGVYRTGITEWENDRTIKADVKTVDSDLLKLINTNPPFYHLDNGTTIFNAAEIKNIHVRYIALPTLKKED